MRTKEILKEASSLIEDLRDELTTSREYITKLESEIGNLTAETRRMKLADDLDKKSLLPYSETQRLRDNYLSSEELDEFEKLSEFDPSFATEKYTPSPITNENNDSSLVSLGSEISRDYRRQYLMDAFTNFN